MDARGLAPIRLRVGGVEAALLIQAACHLTLIRAIDRPEKPSPAPGDDGEDREP
jgi:hypothetical protein